MITDGTYLAILTKYSVQDGALQAGDIHSTDQSRTQAAAPERPRSGSRVAPGTRAKLLGGCLLIRVRCSPAADGQLVSIPLGLLLQLDLPS